MKAGKLEKWERSSKMGRKVDRTGQTFGRWTVLRETKERAGRRVFWDCICICGVEKSVDGNSLQNGNSRSCGCLAADEKSNRKKIDLTGQKFGRLTVIKEFGLAANGCISWKCQCECGKVTNLGSDRLRSGNTMSCGCLAKELTSSRRKIDLTGNSYGRLKVISEAPDRCNGYVGWLCECQCGERRVFSSHALIHNHTRSCGCLRKETNDRSQVDIAGQRFGKLIAIRKHGKKRRQITWLCRCDCGRETIVLGGQLRYGQSRSCGCLHIEAAAKTGSKSKGKYKVTPEWLKAKKVIRSANKSGHEWDLTMENVIELVMSRCYYCNAEPGTFVHKDNKGSNRDSGRFNGIDRIDNNSGYLQDNVVSCCWWCNRMKGSLAVTDFVSHCKRVSMMHLIETSPSPDA